MYKKAWFCLLVAGVIAILSLFNAYALVSVEPSADSYDDCYASTVGVDIVISGLSNVYGFQFDLRYDSNILEVSSSDITEGGFLSNNGQDQTFCWNQSLPQGGGLINNIFCTRLGTAGIGGTGVLAHINFHIKESIAGYPATSNLVLSEVEISDPDQNPLDNSVLNSQLTVTHCQCIDGDTRICTASNGCAGEQTCSSGSWGTCVATENYCDTDCDGTADSCIAGSCPVCECIGVESRDCLTPEGCPGREECSGGYWSGQCEIIGYFCDSDCDGNSECVDQECSVCECVGTESQSCYTGVSSTREVGICSVGTQTCSAGQWGSCEGETLPETEVCDGVLDEDCDGSVDEGCECVDGEEISCGSDVGVCELGTQICSGGAWGNCEGGIVPENELCDGLDNDCDGVLDEDFDDLGTMCTAGLGICENQGIFVCSQGGLTTECNATPGTASVEVCDGVLDEDCDGSIDENCSCIEDQTRACQDANGCSGVQSCDAGRWSECVSTQYFCDSDCDGDSECVDQNCSPCECTEEWNCTDWSDCTDGTQTRTCTDLNDCGTTEQKPVVSQSCSAPSTPDDSGSSGGGGGSSGGSGGFFTPPCQENWECESWSMCNQDGLRRRACEDANDCGTTNDKPKELETCLYTGKCDDGLRNGNEAGVDCGGRCANECVDVEDGSLSLAIHAEPINAEILDNYLLEVVVENNGEKEAQELELRVNGWTSDSKTIHSILPAESKKQEFVLNIPGDPTIGSLEIQLIKEGGLVTAKDIPVELTVPNYGVKLGSDPKTGRIKELIIVDNRDRPAKEIETEYVVNKGRETVFIDAGKSYPVAEGELFLRSDYLHLENLPRGEYEVESVFYENGEVIDRATSYVVLGGEEKADFSYVFYIILVLIIIISVFIFIKSYKRGDN